MVYNSGTYSVYAQHIHSDFFLGGVEVVWANIKHLKELIRMYYESCPGEKTHRKMSHLPVGFCYSYVHHFTYQYRFSMYTQ